MPPTSARFFDKVAAKYDAKNASSVGGPNFNARVDRLAAWFGPDASVLDVGCASGHIGLALAPHVGHVTGIDISPKSIDLAKQHATQNQQQRNIPNTTFAAIDATDPSLDNARFDAITTLAVLHLVDDPKQTLARLHTLLKPGGQLVMEVPFLGDWNPAIRVLIKAMQLVGKAPHVHCFKQAWFVQQVTDAGFQITETKVYNPKSQQASIHAVKPHAG